MTRGAGELAEDHAAGWRRRAILATRSACPRTNRFVSKLKLPLSDPLPRIAVAGPSGPRKPRAGIRPLAAWGVLLALAVAGTLLSHAQNQVHDAKVLRTVGELRHRAAEAQLS